ncbi:MAG TPA: hypothetical protein VLT36_23065 [Candidatus Dormibacteraeota bacterium]|nr:hypothetical protein [Candidatus Dormibacteraeota bacterium]
MTTRIHQADEHAVPVKQPGVAFSDHKFVPEAAFSRTTAKSGIQEFSVHRCISFLDYRFEPAWLINVHKGERGCGCPCGESSRQKTTVRGREKHLRDFRKADVGLRVSAGLLPRAVTGFLPIQPMDRL